MLLRPLLSVPILAAALLAAGCVTPPAEVEAAVTDAAAAPAMPTTTDFAFDGMFGLGVGVCPLVTCGGYFLMTESGSPVEVDGMLDGANLTLTWDARPGDAGMYLGIWWGQEDEEGDYEYVEGFSPLVLEISGLAIPTDDEIWVWAWPISPVMGFVEVVTPQSFTIAGTLSVLPEDAEAEDEENATSST